MAGFSKVKKALSANAHFLVPLGVASAFGVLYIALEAFLPQYAVLLTFLAFLAAGALVWAGESCARKQRKVSVTVVTAAAKGYEEELIREEEEEKAKRAEKERAKLQKRIIAARQDGKLASKGKAALDDDDPQYMMNFARGVKLPTAPAAAPAATSPRGVDGGEVASPSSAGGRTSAPGRVGRKAAGVAASEEGGWMSN